MTEGEDERDSEEVDDASRASEKENFLKVLCDFYNKLSHTYMIPHSTVQFISSQFLKISVKAMEEKRNEMAARLKSENINENLRDILLRDFETDNFIEAQECLTTQYKRDLCLSRNFKYIEPILL